MVDFRTILYLTAQKLKANSSLFELDINASQACLFLTFKKTKIITPESFIAMVSLGDIEGLRVAKAKFLSMNQTEYVVLVVKVMFIEVAVVSLNPIEPSTGRKEEMTFS